MGNSNSLPSSIHAAWSSDYDPLSTTNRALLRSADAELLRAQSHFRSERRIAYDTYNNRLPPAVRARIDGLRRALNDGEARLRRIERTLEWLAAETAHWRRDGMSPFNTARNPHMPELSRMDFIECQRRLKVGLERLIAGFRRMR
jgi:hypothetical protein